MRRSLLWFIFVLSNLLAAHEFAAALRIDDEDNSTAADVALKGGDATALSSAKGDEASFPITGSDAPCLSLLHRDEGERSNATSGDAPQSGEESVLPVHSLTDGALQAVRQLEDGNADDAGVLDVLATTDGPGATTTTPEVIFLDDSRQRNLSYLSLLVTVCTITLYCCFVVCGDANAKALEEKSNELKGLEFSYIQLMTDMEEKVQRLVDMQVDWSQHVFNTKKHDFVEFAMRMRDNPERYGNQASELVDPFKAFVKVWLNVFAESSMEPINEPLVPIKSSEIDGCGSINDIVQVIISKLEPLEVEFVELPKETGNRRASVWQVDQELEGSKAERKAFVEKSEKARDMCLCSWANVLEMNPLYMSKTIERHQWKGKKWFPLEVNVCRVARLNFLTCKHLFLFICFILVHFLMLLTLSVRADIAFLCMIVTVALMWIIVWRFEVFDMVASLKVMAINIRSQKDAMIAKGKEIEAISKKIELPSQIWIYRTRPKLDIVGGLCRKIGSTKWPDAGNLKEFLDSANEGLASMSKNCGTLQEFALLGDEAMKIVRQQAEVAADFINKNLAKEILPELKVIFNIPRLLVVRVISCRDLPKGSWADDYDPYVRLRTKKDGKWLQTECKPNEVNPKWHTAETPCEYRFLLGGSETDLQAEVMDSNSVASDTFIGSVVFPISELSTKGQWEMKKQALEDAGQGELTVECFLANDLENLAQLMPMQPTKDDPLEETTSEEED